MRRLFAILVKSVSKTKSPFLINSFSLSSEGVDAAEADREHPFPPRPQSRRLGGRLAGRHPMPPDTAGLLTVASSCDMTVMSRCSVCVSLPGYAGICAREILARVCMGYINTAWAV